MNALTSELSPALQAWLQKGEYRQLGGRATFTIDEGDVHLPALVLIHGFPTSSWDFEPMWANLGTHFRLITLDMHGFGFSDKPNERSYTIHRQADLFEQLLQQLGITKHHILTHDYGVSVAQELLARQADQTAVSECQSCCFLNGGLFPETHKALLIQKLLLSPIGRYVNALTGFSLFSKSFSRVFGANTKPSDQELRLFWEAINFNEGRHLFHNLITYMEDRVQHRERWLTALQSSPIPLALINGSVDPVSGAHLVDRYRQLDCRLDYLKQFPELGHYPHTEDPIAVATAYLDFFKTCTNLD